MIKTCFRYLLITFLISMVFHSPNCEASDAENLTNGTFDASSKKERADIAKDILGKINSLNAYLPNLKPSELEWIKKEEEALGKLFNTDPGAWLDRNKQLYNSQRKIGTDTV